MSGKGPGAWLSNLFAISLLTLPKALPYSWRIPLIGWVTARIVAPLTGHERRALANLALVCPELAPRQARRIARAASNNAGRMIGEMYSRRALFRRIETLRMQGPGVEALQQAHAQGRPIIAVSGHFGSYDVIRAVFSRAGHQIGGVYRPMANPYINAHYVRHLEAIAQPAFQRDRKGLAQMLRHLRAGNMIALLTDQREPDGALLSFFGQPALTTLSPAEMALKYNALLIPVYGIRLDNGLDFKVVVEEPIAHSDPRTMMQQINDSLEARVRAHMGQWLWVHRRWLLPEPGAAGATTAKKS